MKTESFEIAWRDYLSEAVAQLFMLGRVRRELKDTMLSTLRILPNEIKEFKTDLKKPRQSIDEWLKEQLENSDSTKYIEETRKSIQGI